MKNVQLRIDGTMVLIAAAGAGAAYLYSKRATLAKKLNPASDENIVYSAVKGPALDTVADYTFGAVDLLNPFNDSDEYARQVYGLNDDQLRDIVK